MEVVRHGPLKSGSNLFKAEWHDLIRKCAPRGDEGSLVLVFFPDLNLVVPRKTIHERKYFMSGTSVNDLVNERSGEIVLGTCQIEITKVNTDTNGTHFFVNGNGIRNPSGIRDGVYETCCT